MSWRESLYGATVHYVLLHCHQVTHHSLISIHRPPPISQLLLYPFCGQSPLDGAAISSVTAWKHTTIIVKPQHSRWQWQYSPSLNWMVSGLSLWRTLIVWSRPSFVTAGQGICLWPVHVSLPVKFSTSHDPPYQQEGVKHHLSKPRQKYNSYCDRLQCHKHSQGLYKIKLRQIVNVKSTCKVCTTSI